MDAKDKRILELETQLVDAFERLDAALEKIKILESEIVSLKTNSSNSSKPPSSDIVKPSKAPKRKGKRKIGAQKGHQQHLRRPFDDNQIDEIIDTTPDVCPKCGGDVQRTDEPPKKHQQVELVEKPFIVKEYRQYKYCCKQCLREYESKLPPAVQRAGLFGPNLIALVGYVKGRCHMSYKTIQTFFVDVLKLQVSTGFLVKQVRKVSEALKQPYESLVASLPSEEHLHSDETGGKQNGKIHWNWCIRAKDYTVFQVNPSRSGSVLVNLLGKDYSGILSSDFYSAYRSFARLWTDCLLHSSPDRIVVWYRLSNCFPGCSSPYLKN